MSGVILTYSALMFRSWFLRFENGVLFRNVTVTSHNFGRSWLDKRYKSHDQKSLAVDHTKLDRANLAVEYLYPDPETSLTSAKKG